MDLEMTEVAFFHGGGDCCSDMGTLFKSELMSKCQLYLPPEAAYNCVAELGELGLAQFVDLNPDVSAFQRQFVGEVKRCEEMERKLRYVETEIVKEKIKIAEESEENVPAPAPREMIELEASLTTIENNLREVNTNYVALRKNHLELSELKNMLSKTEVFLSENQLNLQELDENTRLLDDPAEREKELEEQNYSSMKFNLTGGVIERARLLAFEKMLWRVSKGNVFLKVADIEDEMEDPSTGDILYKAVFIIFFQGEALRSRVKKICEGFHASVYPCPDNGVERREMMCGVETRLSDLSTVLTQTTDHRHRLLVAAAASLRSSYVKVRKMKAVYHVLNMFSQRDGGRVLIGEAWMPSSDIPDIRAAVNNGAQTAGATIPPTIEKVPTTEQHPTFNRTNKYTSGFQSLIDSYGVNTYREVNPSVYTIATFPFLFAVMFGDAGHGIIMLVAALWMIIKEKSLESKRDISEIFNIFFGGRYIIFLMSVFSIYTGLIYNDIFSKSVNLFGSHWSAKNVTFTATESNPLMLGTPHMLDPKDTNMFTSDAYPFGLDPAWQSATNKIGFLNTYKMKISLIFGIVHMTFGVLLSLWNKLSKRQYHSVILEFVPQIVFLLGIFGYLVIMIFIKWVMYGANKSDPFSEHCAPNLLITFINMMLMKQADVDMKMDGCHRDLNYDIYMYPGQQGIQQLLLILGVAMIPIMLLGKPLFIMYQRKQTRARYGSLRDELLEPQPEAGGEEEDFSEIMINQGIHTIEYVLGSVSHTASYLRLWALSLAHAQLSEVLWTMVMRVAFTGFKDYFGGIVIYVIFSAWACLTIAILCLMEGLSAFLHTLRLHWVEFQSKFYEGAGYLFLPFSFRVVLKEAAADDKEVMKALTK
jgi:V-type H+-transporting ATPase subunit a